MADKTAFQKLYEKFTMIKRNTDLRVKAARGRIDARTHLVLCVENTPVAILLSQESTSALNPSHEVSEIINSHFNEVAKLDPRKAPKEFDSEILSEHFTHQRIDELKIDW